MLLSEKFYTPFSIDNTQFISNNETFNSLSSCLQVPTANVDRETFLIHLFS